MIYFIVANNKFVKIGVSDNPKNRLMKLQTGNPWKLKLMATMPGDFNTEKSLHFLFKKSRKYGEWFAYKGYLKSCIMAINDPGNRIPVIDIRSFQKAGINLKVRQRMNRNTIFKSKVKRYIGGMAPTKG